MVKTNNARKYILIISLVISSFNICLAETNDDQTGLDPYCNLNYQDTKRLQSSQIESLEINLDNYKKWTRNNAKIISLKSRNIPTKYKKKFTGKLIIKYNNKLSCEFKISIKAHGDWKDHINFKDGKVIQSVDVTLINGNVFGITKFKLLLPETRNGENEVIFSNIMNEIGYLSPRTFFVNTIINQNNIKMLFQEKIVKEFLENNKLREAPILEGNEELFWETGASRDTLKHESIKLARIDNINWIKKRENFFKISQDSLTKLNLIYLNYLTKHYDPLNNDRIYLNFDNIMLSNNNSEHSEYLDIFDLALVSAGGYHGLAEHNRKFYYDPFKEVFYPIYYDGNIDFNRNYYGNLNNITKDSKNILISKLRNINIYELQKKIQNSGVNIGNLNEVVNQFILKIKIQEESAVSLKKGEKVFNYINNLNFKKYYISYFDINKNNYYICIKNINSCEIKIFKEKEKNKLLSQRYYFNNLPVVYVGRIDYNSKNNFFSEKINNSKFKIKNIDQTVIYYNKGIELEIDENEINILQKDYSGKVKIIGGKLVNKNLNYYGLSLEKINKENYIDDFITGCLNIIDVEVKNIQIYFENSICEDAVNLIRVNGIIENINIKNSKSDGLDIDFSSVKIENIHVEDSLNDCVDVSFGEYEFSNIYSKNCGDKGLSIGEKSSVNIENIKIENTNIGLVSKDSSEAFIKNLNNNDSNFCLQSYRKKQEFFGGYILVQNLNCNFSKVKNDKGSKIDIINRNDI